MIYLNFLVSVSIMMILFVGITQNMKTLNCVSDFAFKKHHHNLSRLANKKMSLAPLSLCALRVDYQVKLIGNVTNE